MAEKELSILTRVKGASQAAKDIGKIDSAIGKLGQHAKAGSAALVGNLTKIGLAAGVALAGAVGAGVKSLADLSRVQQQTAAVIASTGGVAKVTAAQVRALAEQYEDITTLDDKVIQGGENMLLTFTNIGSNVFPTATKAMVDMAIAMNGGSVEGLDLSKTAIQVGKALNDPIAGITALRKAGVTFDDQQKKQIKTLMKAGKIEEAQTIILKELQKEFGNAGKAAGQDFGSDLRRLQDTAEDASMALAHGLMPIITRAAKWLKTKLADAAVMASIEKLGDELADAGSKLLDWLDKVNWGAITKGLGQVKDIAAGVVNMFMGLPDWVKTAVITGWGLNKLTGGHLGGLIADLGSGLIKGVLGMNAGVVNIKAGVVNGAGNSSPGGLGGGKGVAGLLGTVASGVVLAGALDWVHSNIIMPELQKQAATNISNTEAIIASGDFNKMTLELDRLRSMPDKLNPLQRVLYDLNANGVRTHTESLEAALAAAAAKIQGAMMLGTSLGIVTQRIINQYTSPPTPTRTSTLSGYVPTPDEYLSSYAVGIDNVPSNRVARIHRGEAVLNETDADEWRRGGRQGAIYLSVKASVSARDVETATVQRVLTATGLG